MTKKQIDFAGELVAYFSNCYDSAEFFKNVGLEKTDERLDVLRLASREWDNAECDAEGATPEQDKALDFILEEAERDLKAE